MSHQAWRTNKTTAERGYGARWQRTSAGYLRSHPLCKLCADVGLTTAATVVDHIVPHRGDMTLFWNPTNWQPCCTPCHNSVKKRQEQSGVVAGCGVDGMPLDPNHLWNRTKE